MVKGMAAHRVGLMVASGWQKLMTSSPFAIGTLFVRQPRGDTRVTPGDRRRAATQRAAEIAERRAIFDANSNN